MLSLIVATLGRTVELERLLESLQRQSFRDFEVIVVDQNADERLAPVVRSYPELRITHIHSDPGVSRARNLGILASRGNIVSTPDDDCWYPDDLLVSVVRWFDANEDYHALFTDVRNQNNQPMRPKLPPPSGLCTKANVWDCTVGFSGFFRREVIDAIGGFDETLGPGPDTLFKACEDIDFCIRPLSFGFKMWYERDLWVYHPDFQSLERLRRVTYPYALAYGYVSRAHHYSWAHIARRVGRSLGGCGLYVCRMDLPMAYLYLTRAIGQFRGYAIGVRSAPKQPSARRPLSGPS